MQTRNRYIVGNWKMNGDYGLAFQMTAALRAAGPMANVMTVVCPPFPLLHGFAELLGMGHVHLGAQDCSDAAGGARTGEVSAAMLVEQNCKYVILGHSERRQHNGETDALVAAKVRAATAAGLVPIICVGENQDQRKAGVAEEVIGRQVLAALEYVAPKELIIAYEPLWAIGTGLAATPDDITRMHQIIAEHIKTIGRTAHILYGGSVKAENAGEILGAPGVDGVLLGGASLDPGQFIQVAKQAASLA